MTAQPSWLHVGAKVRRGVRWYVVHSFDERGLVLETKLPGYLPVRRLISPVQLGHDLEVGELRPFHTTSNKGGKP